MVPGKISHLRDTICALEIQYRAHLHQPCAARAQEPAKKGVVAAGSQAAEIRMIQRVEHVHPKLQPRGFADRNTETLGQSEVEIPQAWLPD